jgi:glycosyltransferase involved in cell wall biosynthesis
MKILYVCSLFHPHRGGIETMVSELSELSKASGIDVTILTKQFPSNLPTHEKINGIKIIRFPIPKNKAGYLKLGNFLRQNEKIIKSDIVHVVGFRHPLPLISWYLAKRWGALFMGTICGGEIPLPGDRESSRVWNKGRFTTSPFLNLTTKLTTCSIFLKKQLIKSYPVIKKAPQVLFAGINLSEYLKIPANRASRPYIISLRRLVPSKGIDILLKSYIQIAKELPNLDLIIAGSGPEEDKLKKLAVRSRVSERISFIGDISLKEAVGYLKSAFCTVVPSRSEGGGLVNVEALALGCPVIATNIGGIKEYVGHGGLLFERDNIDQLSRAILSLYIDLKKRNSLISAGKLFSLKFDWNKLFPKYLSIYKNKKKTKIYYDKLEISLPSQTKLLLNWISKENGK